MTAASHSSLSDYTSLNDSESLINQQVSSQITLSSTIATFIEKKSALEKDYSKKLAELTSSTRAKALKLESNTTLNNAWISMLDSTDAQARTVGESSDAVMKEVVDPLNSSNLLKEASRKKHHQFASKIVESREKGAATREKSKQKYFDSTVKLEAARVQQQQTPSSDEKAYDKAAKAYEIALEAMYISKSQYLLDLESFNAFQSQYYNQILPHVQFEQQILENSIVSLLVFLLLKMTGIERDKFLKIQTDIEKKTMALQEVDATSDQASFVLRNSAVNSGYETPADSEFEYAPAWKDTNQMPTESATYLNNVKLKSMAKISEISPIMESKRREIAGLHNLLAAYEKDRNLGDAQSVLENLLTASRENVLLETQHSELRSQVDLISASLDDLGPSSPHDFKSTSFVTPSSCSICEATLWGKALQCKKCSIAIHLKCELNCPASCGTPMIQRSKSIKRESKPIMHSPTSPSTLSSNQSSLKQSTGSTPTPSQFAQSRFVPPPTLAQSSPPSTTIDMNSAVMLFDFEATTAFEINAQEGNLVKFDPTVGEDENGWILCETSDGRKGLIPASYLRIEGAVGEEEDQESGEIASYGSAVVLYDYASTSPEELSIFEGERLELTAVGGNFGEGWTEVRKDGVVGIVPSSYIELS